MTSLTAFRFHKASTSINFKVLSSGTTYISSMVDPGPEGCLQSLLLTGSHHGAAAT